MASLTTLAAGDSRPAEASGSAAVSNRSLGGPADGRPAYSTANDEAKAERVELVRRVHVVHNGDTLERLAKRYMGDEGRALEIFDLNRDVLTNPHLLPIGAELQLPVAPGEED